MSNRMTEEGRKNLSLSKMGSKNPMWGKERKSVLTKPVKYRDKKCDMCGEYFTPKSPVSKVCGDKCRSARKKIKIKKWRKDNRDHVNSYEKEYRKKLLKGPKNPIVQLTFGYELVANHDSIAVDGFSRSSISACSKYEQSHHKGYIWMKKSEYESTSFLELLMKNIHLSKYVKSKLNEGSWKTDPLKRTIRSYRSRISTFVRSNGMKRKHNCQELLGCDWNQLKIHLESMFSDGMSWDNYGEWHMDHIYPLSWCSTYEEVFIYSHYSNLRPMWGYENHSKHNKYIG